ncbi:uncharacterized protein TRIADDRAFT_62546 [Trichoplax adhaerens]|uniref:Uncharacterized protein n=1 Tax=Trichoplax adhaerens TaxID=10228 RepID=B3SE43_TRIAD|nr:hypothetical protein TRIADDRAFT_62546 [Trichoplax adhaerens]EDV19004.1 hypothetical protein TRIADDRAFT_62546 [Trichoplax adhaerens]|eukprot:XP_002118512.1 hypothetical protein TRIADDRAFT_62546 [Trichoplax adhaerens]
MYRFLILVSLVGIAIATAPKPCCTPKQWEGVVETADMNVVGSGKTAMNSTFRVLMHISYDYQNSKIRVDQDIYLTGGKTVHHTVIGDYKKGKLYSILNGHCLSASIKSPMPEACVPEIATFYMAGTLGATLKYNTFAYSKKDGSLGAIIDVSATGCIPIAVLAFQKAKMQGKAITKYKAAWFKNITAGIKDSSVFDKPKECKPIGDSENIVVDFDYLKYFQSRLFTGNNYELYATSVGVGV